MSALSERVDTSIRAAGTVNSDALAADPQQRTFQFVLDRVAMCLALPTRESRAVVSNG